MGWASWLSGGGNAKTKRTAADAARQRKEMEEAQARAVEASAQMMLAQRAGARPRRPGGLEDGASASGAAPVAPAAVHRKPFSHRLVALWAQRPRSAVPYAVAGALLLLALMEGLRSDQAPGRAEPPYADDAAALGAGRARHAAAAPPRLHGQRHVHPQHGAAAVEPHPTREATSRRHGQHASAAADARAGHRTHNATTPPPAPAAPEQPLEEDSLGEVAPEEELQLPLEATALNQEPLAAEQTAGGEEEGVAGGGVDPKQKAGALRGGGGGGGAKAAAGASANKRISGFGDGASKHLKDLTPRQAKEALRGFVGRSGEEGVVTFGAFERERSFVLNAARWAEGMDLPFPRKKLRYSLTHYTLGKVTRGLLKVLPPTDPVRAAMPAGGAEKWGTCAVVGNGGSLAVHTLGSRIDAHDVVIRLNGGPTVGWEAHVGARTTFRLTNRNHLGFTEGNGEAVLQHVSTPDALKAFMDVAEKATHAGGKVYALDPDFHEYAMSYMDKGVLSNGFYGILLATELCRQVSVYGFLRNWRGSAMYHYYDGVEPDSQQTFRDQKEGDRLEYFLANRSATHAFAEPCMLGAVGSMPQVCGADCRAAGAQCVPGVWHPVPRPGYCYQMRKMFGTSVPAASCMRVCANTAECPGGTAGVCTPHLKHSANPACRPDRRSS